jgi:hypothetical protein
LLLAKAKSQPKGLASIESHNRKQLLRSTNLKAPWTLLLLAFGSQNYPPATDYTKRFASFFFFPTRNVSILCRLLPARCLYSGYSPHRHLLGAALFLPGGSTEATPRLRIEASDHGSNQIEGVASHRRGEDPPETLRLPETDEEVA